MADDANGIASRGQELLDEFKLKGIRDVFNQVFKADETMGFIGKVFQVMDSMEDEVNLISFEGINAENSDWADGADLDEFSLGGGWPVSYNHDYKGNALTLSYQMKQRAGDSTIKLDEIIGQRTALMVNYYQNLMQKEAADFFAGIFTTTLAPDGQPFVGSHAFRSLEKTTFNNEITDGTTRNMELSLDALDYVDRYTAGMMDASGKGFLNVSPKVLLCGKGTTAHQAAKRLLTEEGKFYPDSQDEVNLHRGQYTIVALPWINKMTNGDTMWAVYDPDHFTGNPLRFSFFERPNVKTEGVDINNLKSKIPVVAAWTPAVTQLPFAWMVSKGTNAA